MSYVESVKIDLETEKPWNILPGLLLFYESRKGKGIGNHLTCGSMAGMSRRDFAFFLIGLGVGLIFSAVAIIYFVFWLHHMFIMGFAWRPGSVILALPFVMIFAGIAMLVRDRGLVS
jgi:hypothetical protein